MFSTDKSEWNIDVVDKMNNFRTTRSHQEISEKYINMSKETDMLWNPCLNASYFLPQKELHLQVMTNPMIRLLKKLVELLNLLAEIEHKLHHHLQRENKLFCSY